jgi:hypothetical protein
VPYICLGKRTEIDAMRDAISKTENDFCPNPTKNYRFGQKMNDFCPNVYKNT